jgi:hypothetical protein
LLLSDETVKAQNIRIAIISHGRRDMVTAEMFALLDRLGATEPARSARPLLDQPRWDAGRLGRLG